MWHWCEIDVYLSIHHNYKWRRRKAILFAETNVAERFPSGRDKDTFSLAGACFSFLGCFSIMFVIILWDSIFLLYLRECSLMFAHVCFLYAYIVPPLIFFVSTRRPLITTNVLACYPNSLSFFPSSPSLLLNSQWELIPSAHLSDKMELSDYVLAGDIIQVSTLFLANCTDDWCVYSAYPSPWWHESMPLTFRQYHWGHYHFQPEYQHIWALAQGLHRTHGERVQGDTCLIDQLTYLPRLYVPPALKPLSSGLTAGMIHSINVTTCSLLIIPGFKVHCHHWASDSTLVMLIAQHHWIKHGQVIARQLDRTYSASFLPSPWMLQTSTIMLFNIMLFILCSLYHAIYIMQSAHFPVTYDKWIQ